MKGSVTIHAVEQYDPRARGVYGCCGHMPQPDGRRYTVYARFGPLAALAKFNKLAAEIAATVTDHPAMTTAEETVTVEGSTKKSED